MAIYHLDDFRKDKIDVSVLKANKLEAGLIQPAKEETVVDIAPEHASEPIKRMEDIEAMAKYFLDNEMWRDYMLFIVGINFGLRASDLRLLRFSHLINDNLTFRDTFPIFEKKTRNTRKRKVNRYITINQAVVDAVTLFLEHTPDVSLSDYMFKTADRKCLGANQPITVRTIESILKKAAKEAGLNIRVATHTLRKTFCYWIMVRGKNDPRQLFILQKMLGHATSAQTLDYIGLTGEEIEDAYRNLNLGAAGYAYIAGSGVFERQVEA